MSYLIRIKQYHRQINGVCKHDVCCIGDMTETRGWILLNLVIVIQTLCIDEAWSRGRSGRVRNHGYHGGGGSGSEDDTIIAIVISSFVGVGIVVLVIWICYPCCCCKHSAQSDKVERPNIYRNGIRTVATMPLKTQQSTKLMNPRQFQLSEYTVETETGILPGGLVLKVHKSGLIKNDNDSLNQYVNLPRNS